MKATIRSIEPSLIEVSRDDLRIVTQAVLEHWTREYTLGSGRDVVECVFCGKEQAVDYSRGGGTIHKPDHELNCAVLVATSIAPRQ
ncbi:MAG TPA: hypothetical protein VEH04_16965 [Verrucomicrobiae bacterium]|nr:hypothetical protein [Verrucomicrobiae bacterium]